MSVLADNSDFGAMHNLYCNYENLGGLTGSWEPENTDDDCDSTPPHKKHRSDKDDNENITQRPSICDSPESPVFPRLPDIDENLDSPINLKISEPQPESQPEAELNKLSQNNEPEQLISKETELEVKIPEEEVPCKEDNGEGTRWVYNKPFIFPHMLGMLTFYQVLCSTLRLLLIVRGREQWFCF